MLKRFESKKIKKLAIGTIVALFAIAVALVAILIANKSQKTKERKIAAGPELARAMTYDQFQDGDEDIDGTDYVKFGAFFLRDINGDGYAEKIKGTCKQVGKEDTLYMELNVLTNGYLENGVITINNNNFYLQTAIPKDSEIKDNVISNNATQISLNQINNGTQKLLTGIVRAGSYSSASQKFVALGNTPSNMSAVNSVTLTGTHVAADGTRTAINKTVELNTDWYGTTSAEIPNYINKIRNLNQVNDNTGVVDLVNQQAVFKVTLGMQEIKNELILSKAHLSGTIPQLNGYDPVLVEAVDSNVQLTYDEDTRVFVVEKATTLDDNGKVKTQCYDNYYYSNGEVYKYNKFTLKVAYPLEAYTNGASSTVELRFPIEGYYEGFNNTNTEFTNPYKSNTAKATAVITFSNPGGYIAKFDVYVGKHITNPSDKYIISKDKPLKIYNNMSAEESDDTYIVRWFANIGSVSGDDGITLKETEDGKTQVSDEFIKKDASSDSMENIVSNIGIGFYNPAGSLGDGGWIKVYDDETGELIHEFTKADWSKYTEGNPYRYDHAVKHVKVVTSAVSEKTGFSVYNLKSIDDEYLTEHYTKDEFDNLTYIKSSLVGYVGDNLINDDTHNASYEAPYSMASISLSKSAISTQETEKNMQIVINATSDENANQIDWRNGAFLVKLPKDIIDIEISSVESNNSNVKVSSYETYEENGERFVKINTTNTTPASFTLKINCNVTPDPRIPTTTERFELYASNEDAVDYYNATADVYDVNGNLNTTEKVNKSTTSISMVSPNSLLTNQIASNYDENGSVAVAPQVAIVSKNMRSATVSIELSNNYSNTISDVQILGRVPFKGNKYAITNGDMGSTFTATMTNEGITLPDALKSVVTVYYSENGTATRDLTDATNGWTTTPSDYSKVESYLIDFGDYKLAKNENHTISYNINIPAGLSYNQVAYSHHGIYFCLDTTEGKFKTRTEPNKVGFMIAKQYDLELTKYQKNKTNIVSGATYAVYEDGSDEAKTRVTGTDGKLTLTGLYLDRTYVIKEIKSPDDYELNEEVVKFTTSESNGNLVATKQSGTVKNIQAVQATADTGFKVQIEVEDEAKVRLKVKKTEKDTTTAIKGIGFKLTGTGLPDNGKSVSTNINGEINVKGLKVGEEYTLEETKANGYYLTSPVKFKVTNNNGTYTASITEGETKATSISEEENIPVINISIEDEKIPTYDLDISKIKRVTSVGEGSDGTQQEETVYLQGAKFKLYKGTKELGTYVTDANGKINISGLYQYIDGKDEEAIYVLKETFAPEGYAKVKDISFKVDGSTGELKFINTDGKEEKYTVEGTTVKLTIEDSPSFKLIKKDGETGARLAGIKFAIYNVEDSEVPARNSKGEILGTKETIDGKEYYTVTTDSNGELTADLTEGMYKAVEVQAPDKYDSAEPYYFGIGASREGKIGVKATWGQAIGGTNYERINSVAETSDGGYIVGGYFQSSSIDLGNGVSLSNKVEGACDGMIIKYDSEGNVGWAQGIGGIGDDRITSLAETSDGGYIVGGYFQNSSIDLGNGVSLSTKGSYDGMIIKYDSEGMAEWAQEIGGTNYECINLVAGTSDGGYIVGGYFSSNSIDLGNGVSLSTKGAADGMIIKYDSEGEAEWARGIGGTSGDYINSVAETSDGGYIVGGSFQESIDLGNGVSLSTKGASDGMIIKYNVNGEAEWAQGIGGTIGDFINSVAATNDGGYIAGGYFNSSSVDLGNGVSLNNRSGSDGMIIKYNVNGEAEWARGIGGTSDDEVNSVAETDDGGYIVGGYFYSSIDLGNKVILCTKGSRDGMIIKYNVNGEAEWARGIGGTSSDEVNSVAEISDKGYIVGGFFYSSSIDLENKINLSNNKSNSSTADGMIIKFEKTELLNSTIIKAQGIGGTRDDEINSVAATSDGGYIAGGYFNSSSVDLGNEVSLNNRSGSDGMIIKHNVNGEVEWARGIGGTSNDYINSVAATSDGGYIVGGYFSSSSIDLENGVSLRTKGTCDGMIIKYNVNGEAEWAKGIGGTSNDCINSVAETDDGGYIVGGYFYSSSIDLGNGVSLSTKGSQDGMIIKYNVNGEAEWARGIGGTSNDYINSVAETDDGGYIVGGNFHSSIDIGNGVSLSNKGSYDGMIIKYDSEGTVEWARGIGGANDDKVNSVAETSDGGCIVGGYFQGSIDLGDGISLSGRNIYDGMIIKYRSSGEVEWAQKIRGDQYDVVNSVAETSDGGYIVGGDFSSSSIDLENGVSLSTKGAFDGMIIKYNVNGDAEWAQGIGETNDDYITSVAETSDGGYIAGGYFKSASIDLENVKSLNNKGSIDGMTLKIVAQTGVPEVQELEITNNRKEFKITTDVKEIDNIKGGSISGEDATPYEKVKYGDTSTREIKMVPDEGYEIIGITVNGEEYKYTANADGSYTMPAFTNMTEDKHVVVTYSLKDNKITINKVDKDTKEKLVGAKFKLDQIEERSEPNGSDIIGALTDNGQKYTETKVTTEVTGKLGTLTNNGTYYFVQNADGTYVPTNSKTYQIANGGTAGIQNVTANSYVSIDLTELTGQYAIVINARCSSRSSDYGYATIRETTTAPTYSNSTGRFMYVSGTVNNSDYTSGLLEGGKTYYLHLGYRKGSSTDTNEDQVVINSIKLYNATPNTVTYNFVNNNGKYESTNQGKDSTVANSYVPIDLTNYTGKYNLIVNAEISSESSDYGYATVTENTTRPVYYSETGRFVYISGTQSAQNYTTELQGGKMYYLHLGYYKDSGGSSGDDKFTVNSISISLSDSELYHVTVETNSDGQAITQIPFGKYNLTEIQAPDGYALDSTPKVIEFRGTEGAVHEFTIENEHKAQLVVHHYIKGTTTKLADDESYEGVTGDKYTTVPKLDLDKYELEVDSNGAYVLPVNATGTYKSGVTEVTYYYVEKKIPLTVHHYIEGTTENVPLKAGGTASDVTGSGKEGESYTTSAIADDKLSDEYELVEMPSNANGTYSGSEVVVNYYYKKVSRDVNLVKYKEDGVTPLEGAKFTIDGTEYTTNANGRIQTKLEVGSHEVIEVEAPEGYKLPDNPKTSVTITKATTSEDINITNEKKTGTVTVHHYIEGTTNKVPLADGTLAADETKTGNVGDIYATKAVENLSESYELVAEPDNASGTYVDGNIEVIYYYKAIPAVVTVHHYLEGTTTKLADDETINGLVGNNYTTSVGNVDNKYELVATPANASGKMTRDGVEVIYYYRLKSTSVLVHYYIEGTTTSLSEDKTITGKVDAKYTTATATDIPSKYELVATPTNASGTMTVNQIVVIYYYRLKETGVDVHYYKEGTTEKVAEDVTITGRVDQKYTTSPATNVASKYELVETPANASGTMTEARITVIYYYRLKDTSVLVHHYIEGTTTKLSNDVTINGKVDASYTTKVADDIPSKYELVSTPANASGTMTENQIVVTYYYRLKNTSVLVHHYIKDTTTSLSADVTINGKVDDSYTTKVADDIPEQYELVGTPANASGTMTEAQIVVTYYYQLKSYPYVVNYLEKGSGNILHEAKQGDELVYGSQVKSADERINIDGYVYDSADKDVLTIGTTNNVINIYYTKQTGLSYKVNYLEKGTNQVIHEQKVQNGMTYDAEVISADEVIEIDGYNYNSVDKESLKITTGENVINIYYTKRTDLSYKVNYLEKDTNKVLNPQKNVGNKTFGEVITSSTEVIEIDGYNYNSVDKNSLKITTGENVINIYYTKRTDLSYTVNYLEKGTNKVLNNPKTENNITFGTTITSTNEKIDINGYNYDSADKATLTITTGTNVINLYYTKRTDLSYKVNYLEKGTNKVLYNQKTQNGMTFGSVVNSADEKIDINGYNFDSYDKDTLTIGTGENVINIYYTKRTDLSYKVNYLEKTTNKVLHNQKVVENMTFESVVNSADEKIDINGYNFDSYDKDALTIGTGENVINIYYTKRADLSYTVNYLESVTNNVLHEPKTQYNMTYEDVVKAEDEVIDITGYNYDYPDKYELIIGTDENILNIYYSKVTGLSYTVNYLEKDTNKTLFPSNTVSNMTFGETIDSSKEVIDIDGYNYDSVDKDTLTIGTDNNVINIYYTKRTDLSYKVNYLEKDTNKVLHNQKVQGGMTFESTVDSSKEVIQINGYNYDSVDKATLTIGTGNNIINIYYTKKNDLSYTVNYLEKDTNKVLHNQKVQNGMTFESTVDSSKEVIAINGYNYDSVDKATLTIGTGENVINIYYTKKNDLSYKVNYLEKDSNKVLSNQKVVENVTFETVITSANEVIAINGYNYDSVDKDTLTIGTGENIINIYYTKKTDLSYKVNYLEKGTNKVLHDQKVQDGMTFESVVTSASEVIAIDGYNYDSVDKDALTITTGENIINVYYTKRADLSYTVNYLEKDTNKVLNAPKVATGMTFETIINSKDEVIQINGYKYDSVDKDTLTIGTGTNIINIYYTKVSGLSYTVNYLDKDTDEVIHPAKTEGNQVFENEITSMDEVIDIDGYNFDSVDKDTLVIGTGENIINIYYTKRSDLEYKVNYLEKDTNKVLSNQKTQTGMTFKDTVTASDEVININGYDYDSVDKDVLTIGVDENVINIYYTKRTDLSYKVNYLEKTTNKVLHDQKVVENMTFEDTVDSSKEVIAIDGYNYDSVDKATLTITTGENVINIYYTKKNDLTYKVNYLEKTTNKVLHDQKVVENMTFEDTVDSSKEVIAIDGYNYDSVDKDTLVIGTGDNVINIYYTKKNDLSYKVNYLEKTTNKVLHDQKTQEGMAFEDTVDSSKEVIAIDGYNYDSVDKDTLVIGTGENAINVYYTKRNDLSYTVNYLEKDTNKVLNAPKVQNDMTFESVVDSSKEVIDINGYKYDSVDKDTLTITTGTNVINIYYTKITGLSYTVNYLEKDTNNVINPAKTVDGVTFEDEITSANEVIAIDGYNYDSVDKDVLTIGTGDNIINIYYTKRTDLSYKVNYLEKSTNKVLHEQKVVENMTFDAEVTSSKEVIDIDGYNYDSVDKTTLKITTGENVINIYYTKRNDLSYKVNYLEKDTNKVLHDQKVQDGMTYEDTVTSSKEVIAIDGYNYDSVDKDTLTITTGENVINIYYTKRNDLSYKVNYLEKTTNKVLSNQKVVENMTFESVVTSANEVIDIDGYNYDSVDKDTLTITTGENVINIYYTKCNDLSYKVNYLEKTTNKVLHEQKVVENMTFEDTVDSSKEVIAIDGYNYDSVDKDTLTITTGENVINIYYTKRNDLSYTVNYLEKDTNKVIYAPKVTGNMTFEDEITSANEIIPINGYSYDSVDKDKLIITTGENVINIYYTKVQGLAYTVNYLEKDTDKVIHEPKTTDNMTFEDEITSADEVIEIDGYNYDSVDKDTLVIGTGTNVINIYYTKRNDLSYRVNYLEKDTNKVLHDQKVVENMTFDDVITSEDEVIDIDGYDYDSVDKETLTITTSENIINIYYTKRTDLSYTVNYLEKDTNNVIHDQKVVENMTFESVVNSADEVITIYGYNYDSVDKDTLTITTGENVINIYYTKKDAKVTIHYYEEGTTNKVSNDRELNGKVNDEYTTVIADDIESKYELVEMPANATGVMTEDDITVIYYFRKKATQVIVRHYEEGTTNKLSQDVTINGRVDDAYTTTPATDIPIKYELSVTPANANGTMAETTTEVIYYYRVKDAVVNVRYLEKNTNIELAPADKLDGKVDDPYTVGAKTIDGYTMVEHSGNESGKFEVDPITITYYYLYNTKATVQYIDKITGQILEQSTQEGLEGDEFATESKDFANYILVEEPPQKTVKMTKDEIVLKYYYIHISGGVIEKHIDVISGEILANDTHSGNEGDPYDIKSRTFAGYDLVEDRLPSNASGTMKVDPIEVIYYYIYRTKVTAKYIDRATGNSLTPDVVQDGHEGDAYVTERKTFDDYKLVEVPANADGAMTKENITVTYYYVHTSGGVIINHVDINTGKQLLDETKQEGYEGDPYETHEENIPGYTLVQDKYPANANGTMTIDPTRVTYYYVKNTEVNVKYIDKETGEEIAEKTNIPGNEGDNFTTEPKDVPGYDLVEEPAQKDGTMTAEPIEVIYYYRRPAKVIAKYFDNETKEEIATEEKQEGHQNDEYTTEAKDIKYYKLLETPRNANGTMTVTVTKDENGNDIVEDTTYVNYYYRKLDFNLSIDKKVASVTINGNESVINGDLAKIEVYRKDFNTAKVEVKYTIKVTNDGELSGKASILEDIPSGMTMSADKNSGWDIKGTTATRETKDLQPGESEEYVVVLDWENGANNVGMKENTASIISTENEAGYTEKDTTDNEDKADVIVAISTGGHTYILAAGAILLVLISLAGTVYVIKKRK